MGGVGSGRKHGAIFKSIQPVTSTLSGKYLKKKNTLISLNKKMLASKGKKADEYYNKFLKELYKKNI